MLQLTYSPDTRTVSLVDRRWGVDIYRWQDRYITARELSYGYGVAYLDSLLSTLRYNYAPRPKPLPDAAAELESRDRARYIAQTTPESLLRNPQSRAACWACAQAGKSYSTEAEFWARRPVVRQAVAILAARQAQREAAKRPVVESGRIARLAAERRLSRTRDAILSAVKGLYRTATAGDHTTVVRLGSPSACGDSSKGDRYRGNCTYRKTDSTHTYTVPRDWLETVYGRDLETVDGMLVLSLEPVESADGREVYRAVWAAQGNGFALKTRRGYLVSHGGEAHLGDTAAQALRKCVRPYQRVLAHA